MLMTRDSAMFVIPRFLNVVSVHNMHVIHIYIYKTSMILLMCTPLTGVAVHTKTCVLWTRARYIRYGRIIHDYTWIIIVYSYIYVSSMHHIIIYVIDNMQIYN